MVAFCSLTLVAHFISIIEADDDELLKVFFGNTGLGRWWYEPEYQILADAQIESLNALDSEVLCLTELNVDKLMTQFIDGLVTNGEYPYYYFPPSDRRGTANDQCNCSTELYQEVVDCLNDTIIIGDGDDDLDYSDCWPPGPPTQCGMCWTAYFDEEEGLESISQCDGGNYSQVA